MEYVCDVIRQCTAESNYSVALVCEFREDPKNGLMEADENSKS
jgi:hypothetical protein